MFTCAFALRFGLGMLDNTHLTGSQRSDVTPDTHPKRSCNGPWSWPLPTVMWCFGVWFSGRLQLPEHSPPLQDAGKPASIFQNQFEIFIKSIIIHRDNRLNIFINPSLEVRKRLGIEALIGRFATNPDGYRPLSIRYDHRILTVTDRYRSVGSSDRWTILAAFCPSWASTA
jgi:hypothetical protein